MPAIHALAFSPHGDVLAVGGGNPSETGGVELFDWPSGYLIHRYDLHEDSVYAVAWSPRERLGESQPGSLSADS